MPKLPERAERHFEGLIEIGHLAFSQAPQIASQLPMPSRFQSFSEVRFTNKCQGYPCIIPVGQNEVVVGDWSGNLLRATLFPFAVQKKVFVASKVGDGMVVCNTLRSLATISDDTLLCAVATRGNHAAVWNSGEDDVTHVIPQNGPVNSVTWLDAEHLLLGSGYYSLSEGGRPLAQLEVWKMDEEPSLVTLVALPGICVDDIFVCRDDTSQIVVFSGMKSQVQGFVSILDANSFLPQVVFDLPFMGASRLECDEELIFVAHPGRVQAVSRKDGKEKWSHEIAGDSADFAYDPDYHQLLLSNGKLISAGNGRVVETWSVLTDCCCVRPKPEGGFVAVSKRGIIGVWDVKP